MPCHPCPMFCNLCQWLCSPCNCVLITVIGIVLLAILVIYYIALIRIILAMLQGETNPVFLFFAFLGLVPLPFTVIMGIMVMIIWKLYRKTPPSAA